MKSLIALSSALIAASTLSSSGQNLNFALGGNAGDNVSNGNKISFTNNGVKVTASAWGYTKDSGNTAFQNAKLTQYGPGLGILNRDEVSRGENSPFHQVDNDTENDYILFVFDELVDVSSITVTPSPAPYDIDTSYWLGNISGSNQAAGVVNLSNVTYSGLAALGFSSEQQVLGNSTSGSANIGINAPSAGVNAILFGTLNLDNLPAHFSKNGTDAYKVGHIKATVVPEPSAALLSLLGALGFCLRRRR